MRKTLPEKWCVKADETQIVQKYFLTLPNASCDYVTHKGYINMFFNYPMQMSGLRARVYSSDYLLEDYQELTMQEFKELVLHIEEIVDIPEFLN